MPSEERLHRKMSFFLIGTFYLFNNSLLFFFFGFFLPRKPQVFTAKFPVFEFLKKIKKRPSNPNEKNKINYFQDIFFYFTKYSKFVEGSWY